MSKQYGANLSPTLKYWIFLTGIIAVIFAVIFGSFVASYHNLAPDEQALVEGLFAKLVPFPLVGSIILVAFICTMVSLLFRYYIIPVLRMAEQTRLITAANPEFRITPEGAHEMVMLAKVINESADAFQKLQNDIDGMVRSSNRALKEERNRFAALMSELPYGVVVCNSDGRVMLYNRLARQMLHPANEPDLQSATLGLGRSIFSLLERAPLVHALEVMNHAFAKDQARPALGLMTKLVGNRFIRVNMAPVITDENEQRSITGFVLSLEDITGEVDADNERDRLLRQLIDALQGSLGVLHQSLGAGGNVAGEQSQACHRHQQTIATVAGDIEEHLALARKLFSEHRHAYGNRENVHTETLATLIGKNIRDRFAMTVTTGEFTPGWLHIDSYAIVQTLANLAGFLKTAHGVPGLTISIGGQEEDRMLFRMEWPQHPVPLPAIREWMAAPLISKAEGSADSAEAIIRTHEGVIEPIKVNKLSCAGISVSLPTALEKEPAGPRSPVMSRPVSYEFDLFHQPGQEALGNVPLRNLTYVAFDTETTGLNPSEGDEIIQLGAVRIVKGRLLHNECIDQLVNPQRPVPKSSVQIHGIDPDLLPNQPLIGPVLTGFHAFAADAVLIAHNAAFDMRFLQLKEETSGIRFDNPVLDTLLLSSVVHPNQEGHSLDAIAERFNITIVGRHTALGDALVTAEIFLKLIPLLEVQGILTLQDALDASLKSPFVRIKY